MAAACLLSAACNREEISEYRQISLSLSEAEVKTSLNPARTSLRWNEGDAISVYNDYDANIAAATYQSGANIKVSVPVDAANVKATFPETSGSYADPGFVFPATQEQPAAGVLNGGNYPIVAEAAIVQDAAVLHFSAVGSAFALNVYNPNEEGEKLQYVSVKPAQRESAVKVQMTEPFVVGADKPSDKRTYEGQVYACLEKGQYSRIEFTVVTDRYRYSITSNETVMDLESHDFFVVNLDLAHLKAYIYLGVQSEEFSLDESDVTLSGAGFVNLTQHFPDAQLTEDIIPDFSTVGYHWGEAEFPRYGNVVNLPLPSKDEDATEMIQNTIDAAPEGTVIQFQKGRYNVDGLLILDKNGIILRGSGNRETEIFARCTLSLDKVKPKAKDAYYPVVRTLINLGVTKSTRIATNVRLLHISAIDLTIKDDKGDDILIESHTAAWNVEGRSLNSGSTEVMGNGSPITEDAYCGSQFVTVADASSFNVGESVVVYRPGTQEWIQDLKMNNIIRSTADKTVNQWEPSDYNMCWERTIKAIVGNRLYFDTPLVMSVTREYGGGEVRHYSRTRIKECGIENLKLTSDYNHDRYSDKYGEGDIYHATTAIMFYGAEHCWVKDVETHYFCMSAVQISDGARNITIQNCEQKDPTGYKTGGLRYAYFIDGGQQCLIRNCTSDQDRHPFSTGERIPGPNVFSHCTGTNASAAVGPHQRWATGTLYDNVSTNASMKAYDAGDSGTGQGWQGVNQVFWNCTAASFSVQSPWVTGKNYVIGCTFPGGSPATLTEGRTYPNPGYAPTGEVVWDSAKNGTRPNGELRALEQGEPDSLYVYQLKQRLNSGNRVSDLVVL